MAVRIRLKRIGKIHHAIYRVVVVDGRKKRDGRVIEEIGQYDPNQQPSLIKIDSERAQYWLGVGAQPSDPVRKMLVLTGDIAKLHGKKDAVSRVKTKETIDPQTAREEAVKSAADDAEKRKAAKAEEAAKAAAEKAAAEKAEKEAQVPEENAESPAEAPEEDAVETEKTEEA
ncbi:MAG: 30S ribosomal protein S16 [Varibaculum sp.]|nr:30S ribosomal protein S16 [Varibaculum sp.]